MKRMPWMGYLAAAAAGALAVAALNGRLASVLPLLLFAACPIAMMFMMRGGGHDHGGHGNTERDTAHQDGERTSSQPR